MVWQTPWHNNSNGGIRYNKSPTESGGSYSAGSQGQGRTSGAGYTVQGFPQPGTYSGGNNQFGGYATAGDAFGEASKAANSALNRLGSGKYSNSPFAAHLNTAMYNRSGFSPEAMSKQRTALAEREAGSRANTLKQMRARANASGFGDSMGLIDAEARARTQSAANLNAAENELFVQDELLGIQREQAAQELMTRLFGFEAERDARYADFQGRRNFPIGGGAAGGTAGMMFGGGAGGMGGGGSYGGGGAGPGYYMGGYGGGGSRTLENGSQSAPGYKWLDRNGKINLPTGRTFTDFEYEQAMRERAHWMMMQGYQ